MITAVDTNVLVDVFIGDANFGPASSAALAKCMGDSSLVVCDVVWTELSAIIGARDLVELLGELGIAFLPMSVESCNFAGNVWREYRKRGGKRERVAADFLIGAHAEVQCDCLLTRDAGFCREYFKRLPVITPSN